VIRAQADAALLNSYLGRLREHKLEYREGRLQGRIKLPVSACRVTIYPSCSSSHILLTLPFKEIQGESTGNFFLSKIVSTFWGTIAKQVESVLVPRLRAQGFPADTVTLEKSKEASGEVGRLKISLGALNFWLSSKHPRLKLRIRGMLFRPAAVEVEADLQRLTP
jgi:hypothetical protein